MALIDYRIDGTVAVIAMDDGRANALSPDLLAALGVALDRAASDDASAVVVAGRPGRFSGGFDLGVLGAGGPPAERMLRGGFELAERILTSPRPVVVACTGHALAMGLFLVCSADYRVGAAGAFKLQANEVLIGLPMPYPAIEILRHRLTPAAFDRAVGLAEPFTPEEAVTAGLLDRVVAPDDVVAAAIQVARSFEALDPSAHAASKRRARAHLLDALRAGIEADFGPTPPTD